MERVDRKEAVGRQDLDEEDVDDEPEDIEEGSFLANRVGSKKFEREPEREPEMSGIDLEGNITHSILENEQAVAQRNIQTFMDGPQRMGRDPSLNVSITNESISEMKKETAVPVLKNSERFINRPADRSGIGRTGALFGT